MGSSSGKDEDEAEVSTNRNALDKRLDVDLAKIEADNRIEAHVKATEDAYARVATMHDGEYAQLDDQVHVRVV